MPSPELADALAALESHGLRRGYHRVEGPQGPMVEVDGRRLVSFSSNDYLGLAADPRLVAAAKDALDREGLGAGASRLISGDMAAHRRLETALAGLKGTERVLLFGSGYHANTGVLPALVGRGDAVFSDALNHASLIDGCRLSRAAVHVYRHCDVGDLAARLAAARGCRRRLIVTDSLFSMDGDLAPLEGLCELAEEHDAMLLIDEAHATGVFGARGSGVAEARGLADRIPLQMGTLGKALGSYGGYLAADADSCEWLRQRARSFVFSTALPPPVCAAAARAVELVRDDAAGLRRRLWENVAHFRDGLTALRLEVPAVATPIVPIILGAPAETLRVSAALADRGIWAHAIRPPTVPEGTSRLRMTVTAAHTRAHLDQALDALETVLGRSRRQAAGG